MNQDPKKDSKRKAEISLSPPKIEKQHKTNQLAPMTRMTRNQTRMVKLQENLDVSNVDHFGLDVTSQVKGAMMNDGKEPNEEVRHKMHGDIKRNIFHAKSLDKLVNEKFVKQLSKIEKQNKHFVQNDDRIEPRKGGAYGGHMFTMTKVFDFEKDEKPEPKFKEIQRPSSPRPDEFGKGLVHHTHTSPYSLGGSETNKAKTVNAPSWSNITVDGSIERFAKESVKEYGEGNVFHFRLDSHDRSSLGVIVKDVNSKSEDKRWFTVTTQYKRKDL